MIGGMTGRVHGTQLPIRAANRIAIVQNHVRSKGPIGAFFARGPVTAGMRTESIGLCARRLLQRSGCR